MAVISHIQTLLPSKDIWLENFQKTEKYDQIIRYVEEGFLRDLQSIWMKEPLEVVMSLNDIKNPTTSRRNQLCNRSLTLDSFYILDYMEKVADFPIYDIGCGMNLFKKFYDIVGIDPIHVTADIKDYFDDDFARYKQGSFPAAIAINSLHTKVSVFEIAKRIVLFSNIIKDKGYGFITFNLFVLFGSTQPSMMFAAGLSDSDGNINLGNMKQHIINEIAATGLDIIHLDIVLDDSDRFNNDLDGNIRVLFKKQARKI